MAKVHLYSLCHTWLNLRRLSVGQTALSYQASLIVTAASQYSDTVSSIENLCIIEKKSATRVKRNRAGPWNLPPLPGASIGQPGRGGDGMQCMGGGIDEGEVKVPKGFIRTLSRLLVSYMEKLRVGRYLD